MKHTITKQTKTSVLLTITVDDKYMAVYHQAVLKRLKKNLKVDGFRPGHVPDKIAERELGEAQVQAEVLEEVVAHAYGAAVREANITTVSSPNIEIKKFVPYTELEYTAEAAIMPDIKFDLNKLSVKYDAPKITAEHIDAAIEELRKQMAERVELKTPAQEGNELTIDFEGKREGKPVEGAAGQNSVLLIGEGRFVPGFEENMIGMKTGEKKTFRVTFPKEYHQKDIAGKKVDFSIEVKSVKKVVLPKVDDAFATHIGPFKSVAELKENVKKSLEAEQTQEYQKNYDDKVIDQLIEKATFEVSHDLIHDVMHKLQAETEEQLRNSGLDLEKYLQIQKRSKEDFEKEMHDEAERRVKLGLLMRWVIEQEKLSVTEDEVDNELGHMRERYTDPKMQAELNDPKFRDDLRTHVLTGKAIKKLVDYAKN